VLGLRLVKQTVNFDDPGTYHLYYGDEIGQPGSILTFFPWPMAHRGVGGVGQAIVTAYAVPPGSLEYWRQRLTARGVRLIDVEKRFDERAMALADPDGLRLELVERASVASFTPWTGGPVPVTHALRGLHSVTLAERSGEATAALLTGVLGFRAVADGGGRSRFAAGDEQSGSYVDILHLPDAAAGRVAAGSVHHVAWRVPDGAAQQALRSTLMAAGVGVTPVLDRQYFQSIYFREPGGVLFEIATEPPGFTLDEEASALGRTLKLPPWLEPDRDRIEAVLPRLPAIEIVADR